MQGKFLQVSHKIQKYEKKLKELQSLKKKKIPGSLLATLVTHSCVAPVP